MNQEFHVSSLVVLTQPPFVTSSRSRLRPLKGPRSTLSATRASW